MSHSKSLKLSEAVFETGIWLCSLLLFGSYCLFSYEQTITAFDITDEGFAILSASFPGEVLAWTNWAHFISNTLISPFLDSVYYARLFSYFLLTTTGFIFSFIFALWITERWRLAIPIALLFTPAVGYLAKTSPVILNYDSIGIIAILTTFCFLISFEKKEKNWKLVLAGFSVYALSLAKPPNALFFLFLLTVMLFLRTPQFFIRKMCLLVAGILIGYLFHFLFFQSPEEFFASIKENADFVQLVAAGYDVGLLSHYSFQFYRALTTNQFFFISFTALLSSTAALFFVRKHSLVKQWCQLAIPILLLSLCIVQAFHIDRVYDLRRIALCYLALTFISLALFFISKNSKLRNKIYIFSVLFIFVTLIGPLGTNSQVLLKYLNFSILAQAACFGLLFNLNKNYAVLFTVLFGFTSVISISKFSVETHHRREKPNVITVGTEIPFLQGISLGERTYEFIHQLYSEAYSNGLKRGTPIIGLFNVPGLVYILGGYAPVIPWISGGYDGSKGLPDYVASRISLEEKRSSWLLFKEHKEVSINAQDVRQIFFKKDKHVLVWTGFWPVDNSKIELWAPENEGEQL